jgi:hypothetical protein
MTPLIYFSGMFLLLTAALLLNAKFKWLTKKNADNITNDVPLGLWGVATVTYLVFWPITFPLTLLGFVVYFTYYFFVPND